MEQNKSWITVETLVPLSKEKTWELWTAPEHIQNWNFASEEWCCPAAENDLKPGGKFSWRMEARDGSMGFDYSGIYKKIDPENRIEKELDDQRKVIIEFIKTENGTLVRESFEPESQNSKDLQKQGWQAILDNFKAYAISKK